MKCRQCFLKGFAGLLLSICFISFPALASATTQNNNRYYLQVGSFRIEGNALRHMAKIQEQGMPAVVSEKQSAAHGILHQVFVGPFESRKAAEDMKLKLRKAGIFLEDAFVVNEEQVMPTAGTAPEAQPSIEAKKADRPAEPPPRKEADRPSEAAPQPDQMQTPTAPKPALDAESEAAAPGIEAASGIEKAPEETPIATRTGPAIAAPDEIPSSWGDGRNLAGGAFSVAYRHSYVDYGTEITQRTAISDSGGTVTSTPVSTAGLKDLDFDTDMHIDAIRLRYGITDFFEIYGDLGTAYRKFETPKLAYGGGARLNWLSVDLDGQRSIYSAYQIDFLTGDLEDEYSSTDGQQWKKEADWQSIDLKIEVGLKDANWRLYGGGTYGRYEEDTKRTLLSTPPAPLTGLVYEDELEQESEFSGFAGFDYYFTPRFKTNFEGQLGNQNRVTAQFQYSF